MPIINELVKIKITHKNIDEFIKLGYNDGDINKIVYIESKNLNRNCSKKVKCICDYCGKEFFRKYCRLYDNINSNDILKKKIACCDCKEEKKREIKCRDNNLKYVEMPDDIKMCYYSGRNVPEYIFRKYYNLDFGYSINVDYKCEFCGEYLTDSWNNLKYKINNRNKLCCKECILVYDGLTKFEDILNESDFKLLKKIYSNNEIIEQKLFEKYYDIFSCHKNVNITCAICGKKEQIKWSTLRQQMLADSLIHCKSCSYTIGNKKSLKKYPDLIERRINKTLNTLYNTEKGKNSRKIISEKLRNSWINNNNRKPNVVTLQGYYNGIMFDSSYELSFIKFCLDNNIDIVRCIHKINYNIKGEEHVYIPDFIINNKIIIEIKGKYTDLVDIKKEATLKFIAQNKLNLQYKILYKKDLIEIQNFILYDSRRKLELLINDKNLVITKYPKCWV